MHLFFALLMTAAAWRDDAAFVQKQIEAKHPNPYRRTTREAFQAKLRGAADEIGLMKAVASLRDGHTRLLPGPNSGYDTWFPVRFYALTDGLFITAIDKRFPNAAGAKVVRIGRRSAAEAMAAAKTVWSSDNDLGANESASILSCAPLLRGLGINDSPETLPLELTLRDGTTTRVALPVIKSKSNFDWTQWGELNGPPGAELVTAFAGEAPLHARDRKAYWYTWLEQPHAVYVQLNAMADKSRYTPETFAEFLTRLFAFADAHDVDKFILDIRYNGGGNGRLINRIVHPLIKRDATINRRGHLYVLVGRKTFSAGVGLLLALREHTNATYVGEPAGAALNASGDPDVTTLPNSGFSMSVSTNFYIGADFKNASWEIPIEIPAQFSSADYFGSRDPALDAVLSGDSAGILDVLESKGGAAAKALYERRKAAFGSLAWWQPFDRIQLNELGLQLVERGKIDDGVAALEMNVDRFPNIWETWDSLAEALMAAKQDPRAIAAYDRALQLSPDNWNAAAQKKAIEKMRAATAGGS